MPINKMKILIVGPKKSGKSGIANYLADPANFGSKTTNKTYLPTVSFAVSVATTNFQIVPVLFRRSSNFFLLLVCGLRGVSQVAARILEFDRDLPGDNSSFDSPTASIELWDVSGNQQYERTYPAIMNEADAVILCYDAVDRAQEQEVSLWFEWFVKNPGLDDRQRCLVLAHSSGAERPRGRVTPPRQLQSAAFAMTNFEDVSLIEKEFVMLCERVQRGKAKSRSDDRK